MSDAQPIVFHAYVTPGERDASARTSATIGLRMLLVALPIVCFELWPLRDWFALVFNRPTPWTLPRRSSR